MLNTSRKAEYKQPELAFETVESDLICQSPGGAGGHGETGEGDDPLD